MVWRGARDEELPPCLDIQPRHAGYELAGAERGLGAWRALLRSPSFQSAVIEADLPIAGHRILAFGASVFVRRPFADEELSNSRPSLAGRIIASMDRGQPAVLDAAELRSANTDGHLDLVILSRHWRADILRGEDLAEAKALLGMAYLRIHAGFRLDRIITENLDEQEEENTHSTGLWKTVGRFGPGRSLSLLTRDEGLRVPGGISALLFQYTEPVLGLIDSEQELLNIAVAALSDEELAVRLGIRLPAVKKRWRSIFERASSRPDLFPEMQDSSDDGSRGRQKRHSILAYVREHPEELRPFDAKERAGGK
jgi:DNA-binding CsgD family transcriptional regulator